MPYKNNYWKQLLGERAQVLIGKNVAYTTQATLALFQANAALGEVGIFDADTMALVTAAAPSTERLFFAAKRDGAVERSVAFKIGEAYNVRRTAYSAPVLQVSSIHLSSTVQGYAQLLVGDILYTALAQGTGGNAISVANVVAGNSTALSVAVTSNAIVVNLATSSGGVATSTAAQVQAAIVASGAASALVNAAITGNPANVQAALAATNLSGGAAATTIPTGTEFFLRVLETTVGSQPFPTWDYDYTSVQGDTIDSVGVALANMINNKALVMNTNRDLVVTAVYTAATNILQLTAIYFGSSFRIQVPYGLTTLFGAFVTYDTPMHQGSGYYQQVQAFQAEGDVYKGVTTNYPLQGSNPADYGQPTDVVDAATPATYTIYNIQGYGNERSKTPAERQFLAQNIVFIVPGNGTNPDSAVQTVLGL